jgi:protein-tyrosine phosphatase
VQPGDLLLAMEVRQVHELTRRLGGRTDVQVALLGNWCSPPAPHLHDPFTLSDAYFDTCFARIHQAVGRLANDVPNARAVAAQKRG